MLSDMEGGGRIMRRPARFGAKTQGGIKRESKGASNQEMID